MANPKRVNKYNPFPFRQAKFKIDLSGPPTESGPDDKPKNHLGKAACNQGSNPGLLALGKNQSDGIHAMRQNKRHGREKRGSPSAGGQ